MCRSARFARSPFHPAAVVALLLASAVPRSLTASEPPGAADHAGTAAESAQRLLAGLDAGQRDAATSALADPERTNWTYVPRERGGVALRAMDPGQQDAVFDFLGHGLGERGLALARGVIALEGTLRAIERASGSPWAARRDPGLYHLSFFGEPRSSEPWAWRFEGHHLSVNVTHMGSQAAIVAPLFVGANPARVPDGPQAGQRLLAAEEDLAFELLGMLDASQRARATVADRTAGDILSRDDPAVAAMAFDGLPASAMTAAQQQALRRLLELYAARMTDAAARAQLARIDEVGFERLHFAWAGAHRPGQPHYYRIHGPTVLVEYDNSQGGANHIHTVWRDLENDFGGDLLRAHYAGQAHRH